MFVLVLRMNWPCRFSYEFGSALIFSLYGSYYALTNSVMGPLNVASYSMVAGVFILGLIIYYVAKMYRLRKEGLDLGLLIKEIPPE